MPSPYKKNVKRRKSTTLSALLLLVCGNPFGGHEHNFLTINYRKAWTRQVVHSSALGFDLESDMVSYFLGFTLFIYGLQLWKMSSKILSEKYSYLACTGLLIRRRRICSAIDMGVNHTYRVKISVWTEERLNVSHTAMVIIFGSSCTQLQWH